VTARVPSTLSQDLYVFGAAGLQQKFKVRPCAGDTDLQAVTHLVRSLALGELLLDDVLQFVIAGRDDVSHSSVNYTPSVIYACSLLVSANDVNKTTSS